MSRFSPTVQPDYGENYGDILAEGIETYRRAKRGEKADARAEEEYSYTKGRREKLDPLEDALLRAKLYEQGIVQDEEGGAGLPGAIEEQRGGPPNRGGDFPRFGEHGLQPRPATGLMAPGSFNPVTGGFNPPMDPGFGAPRFSSSRSGADVDPGFSAPRTGREPDVDPGFTAPDQRRTSLGGGYSLDPSRTPEGRKESQLARQIEAAVRSGIPRDEAELEIRSREGLSSEHFHPGAFHPKTRAEYDEIEKTQHQYRLEEVTAAARERNRDKSDRDPRWEERRKTWVRQLGEPGDEMEQDILDALASGYSTDEIVQTMPASRKGRAQRYLRRAARKEQRGAAPEPE